MTRPRFLQALWPRTGISTRLLFFFLCISLIPCGVLTALTLSSRPGRSRRSVRQNLMAISDAKTTQLETYIRERRGDMVVLGRSPSVMEATPSPRRPAPERAARLAGARRGTRAGPAGSSRTSPRPTATRMPCCSTPTATCCSGSPPDLDPGPNLLTGPLRDSELAEVFDRVRTLLQVEPVRLPGVSRPERAGRVHRRAGLRRRGADRRLPGAGAGQPRGLPDLHRLQRPGRDRRDGGRQPRRQRDVVRSPRRAASRTRCPTGGCRSAAARPIGDGAGRAGRARLRPDHRLPRRQGDGRLVVPPVVPLGHGGQAGLRRGLRPDHPPGQAGRGAPGRDVRDRHRRRAAGGADDHAADPRGGAGGRPHRLRRPHGHHRRRGARRGRHAPPGDPQDDPATSAR